MGKIGMARTIVPVGTKSDRFRAEIARDGATVSSAAEIVGIGYAFAYGIAKRTPDPASPGKSFATTRAARRGSKSVAVADGIVTVRIVAADGSTAGYVRVDTATGKTVRSVR
jgi:hypothetical protein